MFAEIDVTSWRTVEVEPMGSREKWWLEHPITSERWLWKERTHNNDLKRGRFAKGDDWAEAVAGRLATSLGIPVPTVELATRDEMLGTITRTFRQSLDQEMVWGNELLAGIHPGYPTSDAGRNDPAYTLSAVIDVLATLQAPTPDPARVRAVDWFAGYLVFDAWIGNTDRHHENWGAIKTPDDGMLLAPSYDHASSMGFMLSDEERVERLAVERGGKGSVEGWAERAHSRFFDCDSLTDAASRALKVLDPDVAHGWREALAVAADGASAILDPLPAGRISEPARAFAARLMEHNAALIVGARA